MRRLARLALGLAVLANGCHDAPPRPTPPAKSVTPETARPTSDDLIREINRQIGGALPRQGAFVGWTIVVDPQLQEEFRVSMRELPWRDAVDVVAKVLRCDVVEDREREILRVQRAR